MYTDSSLIFKNMESKITKVITSESSNKLFKALGHFILVVFITSFLHWALVNFYSWNCVDSSWTGVFTHIIKLGSPFCQFVNYIQFEISKYYVTIWASAGIAIVVYFIGTEKK
jgi:hypothetical protein